MKRLGLTILLVLVSTGLLLTGCSDQKPAQEKAKVENLATTPADVRKEAKDLADTAMAYAEEQKALYVQQILDRLAQYNEQFTTLDRKMAMLGEQAKTEMAAEMANFGTKKAEVTIKFRELQAANADAYEDLKGGMEKAIDELDKAYGQAMSRY